VTLPPWHEEAIQKSHRRQEFDCGDADMNLFLQRFARQSHDQNASRTFCAIANSDPGKILSFYTVTPAAVDYDSVPPRMTKGLAHHEVGGFKLARVATDVRFAGQGLGGQLIAAAALRCLRAASEVGGMLFVIDAKNERAAAWYAKFGAESTRDQPLTLVVPLATFAVDLEARGLLSPSTSSNSR
jgi:GNAT superfamily N-acetyltransferase